MPVRRLDSVPIDTARLTRTPTGGLRIPAALTRCGVFEYRCDDGTVIREYRPDTEVFAPESTSSVSGAAITELHPIEKVNPDNWSRLTRGHVVEGSIGRDGDFLIADIAVNDRRTIDKIDARELVELSCGYDCDIDATSGTSPDGQSYDQVQRNIRYNHVALGPLDWGRAGKDVKLRLDSAGNQIAPGCTSQPSNNRGKRISKMRTHQFKMLRRGIRVDGVDYSFKTKAECLQAQAACNSALADIRAELATTRMDDKSEEGKALVETANKLATMLADFVGSATEQAQTDAEEEKKPEPEKKDEAEGEKKPGEPDGDEKPADKKDTEEEKQAKMDSAVQYLADVRAKAAQLLPSYKADGKPAKRIVDEVLREYGKAQGKAFVSRLDSMSADAKAGLFDGIEAPRHTFANLSEGHRPNNEGRNDSSGKPTHAELSAKVENRYNNAHKGRQK